MIILEPYNHQWPEVFIQERNKILSIVNKHFIRIEHIGSTAIPNIYAKPIIDIMIGVAKLKIADKYLIKSFQSIGYEYISVYEQLMPKRRFFQKKNEFNIRTHYIHLIEYKSDFWLRHILFRNYLRANPKIAKEYEKLKLSLAPKFTDSNQYAAAKSEFINQIIAQASKSTSIED